MDGTLSWEPFVEQTISMARNVHKHRYRMGVGYKVASGGTVTENYWEKIPEGEEDEGEKENGGAKRNPYRIELVGVVCDAYLAVVRGMRYESNLCCYGDFMLWQVLFKIKVTVTSSAKCKGLQAKKNMKDVIAFKSKLVSSLFSETNEMISSNIMLSV